MKRIKKGKFAVSNNLIKPYIQYNLSIAHHSVMNRSNQTVHDSETQFDLTITDQSTDLWKPIKLWQLALP